MFLFTRQARLTGLEAAAWAVAIGAAASKATGSDVGVWARAMSPGYGTVSWTTFWDDLAARETAFDALAKDAEYLALAAEGAKFITTGIDDALYNVVYPGSNPGGEYQYVGAIQTACASGNLVRGMTTGVELAKKGESISGHSTTFVANVTGQYGGVGWLAGYKSIAEFEASEAKLASDAAWLAYVDGAAECYSSEASVTQSVLYARLS